MEKATQMPLPTTAEEVATKKACDLIVHKIMDARLELNDIQDPTDVVARIRNHSVCQRIFVRNASIFSTIL